MEDIGVFGIRMVSTNLKSKQQQKEKKHDYTLWQSYMLLRIS